MKVTVNFGAVRVIVPCGKGDLPVKQLMDLAITRYKKATGKSLDSWVTIHNLKLLSDGGILDPDDKLNDVADDREQITAIFDEEISPYYLHNGGDGTSASSIGTESPDIFQNGDLTKGLSKSSYNGSDVQITEEKISSGLLNLHVRRGSEPALNQLPHTLLPNGENCKRWSAAILASSENFKQLNSEGEEQSEDDIPPGEREDGSGEEKSMSLQNYITSWATQEDLLTTDKRREPLGGPITSKYSTSETDSDSSSSLPKKKIEVVKLKNEDGPLGIRIVPADDSPERNEGVIIEGIEPGGRIDRDGRLAVGDRITAINGLKLSKDSYRNAHNMLKDAMKAPELSIHCIKKEMPGSKHSEKDSFSDALSSKSAPSTPKKDKKDENEEFDKAKNFPLPMPLLTPKKIPAALLHKGTPVHSSIRKIGRRILVHLTKGPEGLGFSITSKDPNNGPPFFIKNILPAGAAVDDGRLKTGDKLIEVNKVDVSSMTQAEVLNILRKVPFNDVVELVISRQETDLSPSPSLPRQLPLEKAEEDVGPTSSKKRDIFTFEVPLNDTGSAGLGISVKGKTSNTPNGPVDMGIFIKNIFHGGAAHKDGRLHNNDQLLNVNGISLLGMTNGQAMETLRRAMIQSEGPTLAANAILLTVARRASSGDNPDQGDSFCHDRSDSLLSESGDSFYVSNENLTTSNKCNGQTPDTSTSDHSNNTVIHISPLKKVDNEEANEPLENSSRDYSSGDYNSVLKRLTAEHNLEVNNLNNNSQVNSPVQLKRNCGTVLENELLTTADIHESNELLIDLENHDNGTTSYNNTSSHQKSLSSPVKSEYSHYPYLEERKVTNNIDSLPNSKQSIHEKFLQSKKNQFRRSGFGRQSMPEKMFSPTYQRNQYLCSRNSRENNLDFRDSNMNSHLGESQNLYDPETHQIIREMPVDVGPCESYVISRTKRLHKTKVTKELSAGRTQRTSVFYPTCCWSCNSPDCPYHAVPTRRESGSSEEPQVGPSLGLFKSSSLESLQTMVQEQQKQGLISPVVNNISSRGCNESFRAAVDKSFEVPNQTEASDPQVLNSHYAGSVRNHTRAKTVDVLSEQTKKNDKGKKKGIFRGLGSMFRFGKSSKKSHKEATVSAAKEFNKVNSEPVHLKPDKQYQTVCKEVPGEPQPNNQLHSQRNHTLHRQLSSRSSFTFPRVGSSSVSPSQNELMPSPQNQQNRMNVLRLEHQRKHKQRNGFYPHDNEEEMYEQQIKLSVDGKAMKNRPLPPLPNQQAGADVSQVKGTEMSPKSKSLEIYKEMSKPGSRKGFADPIRYSHYMNFQEIQQHLQQFRLHQNLFSNEQSMPNYLYEQQARSSNKRRHRHTVSSPRSRPISEFIDFNSAEAYKHVLRGMPESGSLPKRMFPKQRPPIPSAFMFQERHDQLMTNEYPAQNFNQDRIEFHRSENASSSKV